MNSKAIYFITAFCTGMSVMIVELSASRLLAPFFGTSLFVWTNVIGLIMLALAGGYMVGGKMADKNPKPAPYFRLVGLTGVWIMLIPFASPFLLYLLFETIPSMTSVVIWGSFFMVLILFVFPLFVLGMIVPYTTKLVTRDISHLGTDAGRVSMVSTLGSLVGTFMPAFVLLPTIGTMKTFVVVGVLLIALSGIGLWRRGLLVFLAFGVGLYFMTPPTIYMEGLLAHAESSYGEVFIQEDEEGRRNLYLDQTIGIQSSYEETIPYHEEHYYTYFALLPELLEEPKTVLILGHAGGVFTRLYNELYPELSITGVELNPKVTELAREYLYLDELEVEIVHQDARTFLAYTEEKYDLILVDAYHAASMPPHMTTQEFFALTAEHLNAGGVVALNAAATPGLFLETLKSTFASVFPEASALPIPGSFNTMILSVPIASDDFSSPPEQLRAQAEYFKETVESIDSSAEPFTDDRSARVEVLTQRMLLDLLSNY